MSRLAPFLRLIAKGHVALIELLAERGALTTRSAAELLNANAATIADRLEQLVDAGVATRTVATTSSGPGRPAYLFELTPGALELIKEATP